MSAIDPHDAIEADQAGSPKVQPPTKSAGDQDNGPWMCENCGRTFAWKHSFTRHHRRKNPCRPVAEKIPCPDCGKTFARQSTLDRHRLSGACAAPRKTLQEQEIEALEARLAELKAGHAPAQQTTNITLNSHTNNGTQINVTVNAATPPAAGRHNFGQEDLSYITPAWLQGLMASLPLHLPAKAAGAEAIRKTMEGIWADGNHPENLTVLYTSSRKDPLIFDNGVWKSAPMAHIQARMQSRAVDIVTNGPKARRTDEEVFLAIREDELCGGYLLTARSTMQNARTEIQRSKGGVPRLGEGVPTLVD